MMQFSNFFDSVSVKVFEFKIKNTSYSHCDLKILKILMYNLFL